MANLDKYILFFDKPFQGSSEPESFDSLKKAKKFVKVHTDPKVSLCYTLTAAYKKIDIKQFKQEKIKI